MVHGRLQPSIIYVVDRYPELSQTFVRDEIHELRRQGQAVVVVALREGEPTEGFGRPDVVVMPDSSLPTVWRLATVAARHPVRFLHVLSLLKRMNRAYLRVALAALPGLTRQPSLRGGTRVHAHFAWGASSVAAYLAAYLDVPLSITVHARDLYIDPQNLAAKFDAADAVITVCEYNRSWLANHGCPTAKICVVPCGVAASVEVSTYPAHAVVGIGRLVPKKGFDILVRAAALARSTLPDLHVTIIGDGPERAALAELIVSLGLENTVTLRGALDHDAALASILEASVFALPCRVDSEGDSDALPVVIREAMARAVPVISTAIAGIPETVTPETGWIVACDDPSALAEALGTAFADVSALKRKGAAGKLRIEQHYTVGESVTTLRAVFAGHLDG